MPNTFTIPVEDQSIYFLGRIFGNVGNVLAMGPNTVPPTLVTSMFMTLNTIALTVGAIIVIYTTVVGMMKTAAEGEFLGKQWNSLWVPIRMVAGVASLFPSASGYSIIQIIIMWIIVQGIGAADAVWSAAINTNKSGAAYASQVTSPAATIGVNTQMSSLFKGLVCESMSRLNTMDYKDRNNIEVPDVGGALKLKRSSYVPSSSVDPYSDTYPLGEGGICGTLNKCNQATTCKKDSSGNEAYSRACIVCKAQNQVLNENIKLLRSIADKFAQADGQYIIFHELVGKDPVFGGLPPLLADVWVSDYCKANQLEDRKCCVPPPVGLFCLPIGGDPKRNFPGVYDSSQTGSMSADELTWIEQWSLLPSITGQDAPVSVNNATDFIKLNGTVYSNALAVAGASFDPTKETPDAVSSEKRYEPAKAQSYGWIVAGTYFYQVVNAARAATDAISMPLSVDMPTSGFMQSYRSNYQSASDFVSAISKNGQSGGSSVSIPGAAGSGINDAIGGLRYTLSGNFINMLKGSATQSNYGINDNALLRVANFGQNLLIIAQVFYIVLISIYSILAFLAGMGTIMVFGSGNFSSGLEAFKAVNSWLTPALFVLLGALMSMGALLGMYIPMIPFVVFTAAAVGWFIAVIEAMVAGPIIALGLLSPGGGQSEVFGKAEPSLMILLNLFLRPSLMVMGLLIASFLADVVITLIAQGFQFIMWDVMRYAPGLVEEIIFIAIFTSLLFTSMNQVFSLIHHIPERILTFIGGQAMQYGEAQAAQAMKQSVEGAASGVAGASKAQTEGSASAIESSAKAGADKDKGGGKGINLDKFK